MNRSATAPLAIGMLTLAGVTLIVLDTGGPLRAILALLLVFVLPGYAITTLTFQARAATTVDGTAESGLAGSERLLLTLLLSVAFTAVSGVFLGVSPWGLQAGSWSLLAGIVTVAALSIAWLRHDRLPIAEVHPRRPVMRRRDVALMGLAGLVVAGALAVAIHGAQLQTTKGSTQLWILPAGADGQRHTVRIGVNNMEQTTIAYTLRLEMANHVVGEWTSIELDPRERWEMITVLPETPDPSRPVTALLYRLDQPQRVYRRVVISLPNSAASED